MKLKFVIAICLLSIFPVARGGVTLDKVLNTTLEENPAIRQAKANLEQAAGRRLHLEENVASQSDRYRAGLVDRSAFMAATVEARELDPLIEAAQRGYAAAQLQLSQAMGVALSSDVTLPSPEGKLSFAPTDVDLSAETEAALQRRTDIKLARLLVRAANE